MDHFIERSMSYVPVSSPDKNIGVEGTHFFLGSCFAENLYLYYRNHFVDCFFSPFGNIYNPLSLAKSIEVLCSEDEIDESEIFQNKELWRHFDFDMTLCSVDRKEYFERIQLALDVSREALKKSAYLYITLGTAYVYQNKPSGQIVNNCHKLPSKDFDRYCASIEEMKEALLSAFKSLKKLNPGIEIIITLSPVRHLRDNPTENSLSKAKLRCLIDELSKEIDFWYFPAYEIILDQLRDYRWFDRDLAHPSVQAVEYVMDRFVESAADEPFKKYLHETGKLRSRLNHRVLHPETEESKKFKDGNLLLLEKLQKKYPHINALKEASI